MSTPLPDRFILDIDLDFWAPETGYLLEKDLDSVQTLMKSAHAITMATSPYYIDQTKAIAMIHRLLSI
jgi:hypothetical protein